MIALEKMLLPTAKMFDDDSDDSDKKRRINVS